MPSTPPTPDLDALLALATAAVDTEGVSLADEARREGGPRGARGKAPVDDEIEHRLRAKLQAALPCTFVGEETGVTPGPFAGWHWLVDPHDGTSDFLKGIPGSAISVALLRGREPVLGVVHCPFANVGRDTFAWAEGCGPLRRNGVALGDGLAARTLAAGEKVWVTASALRHAAFFAERVAPASLIAMPSIAHRLARVAAGEGVAAITIHGVAEYDIAAGAALMRGAGGVLLDASGAPIVFSTGGEGRFSACFAGAPRAAAVLAARDWTPPDA